MIINNYEPSKEEEIQQTMQVNQMEGRRKLEFSLQKRAHLIRFWKISSFFPFGGLKHI